MRGEAGGVDDDRAGLDQPIRDPLTGAYSRGLLLPRLTEELSRAARGGAGCSLFLFDVDYFKSVNDAYGHLRGDQVLTELVRRIEALIRGYDVLFRYGGDEFVLLLPETGKADAVRVAVRLTEGIRSTPLPGEPPLAVSVSLGVATFPDDAMTATDLMACADRRNYIAKRRGRACAVADDVETGEKPSPSRLLERDLPLSTAQGFLTALYGEPRGGLRVTGEVGAGQTRFLAEVAKLGQLRGYRVVPVTADGPAAEVPPGGSVLVLADRGAFAQAAELVRRLDAADEPPDRLGVVYVADGWADPDDDASGLGLPEVDSVELLPWSTSALRVWLRMMLQGEPGPELLSWLSARGGGLPARVERELDRLRASQGLVRADGGGWTIADAVRSGRRPARRRLPTFLTELVGRQQETAQVVQLLAERRLITLAGPGGIGKTRLSLAVAAAIADRFDDGVAFVPLAHVSTPDLVAAALAQALEVTELPGEPLRETVAAHLADRQLLLVLDNFEQVTAAIPLVAELLAAAPEVRFLVSSRQRLSLYGEQVYQVPPLPLPDPATLRGGAEGVAAALAASPALALFHSRARDARYDFALTPLNLRSTVDLCRRLDGLPLAIELAAARTDTLAPDEMLAQLSSRLDLPGDGPTDLPDRQRTLRGALDWSVALLEPADRELFDRLGAFDGGFDLAAVAALYADAPPGDELDKRLAGLVDHSLLAAETAPDGPRYTMLETIRAYAAESLAAGPAAERVSARHAAHFVAFAAAGEAGLTGAEQGDWAGRIERDYQNLRAAFGFLIGQPDAGAAARVVLGLWRYWRNGSHIGEGRAWVDQVLAVPDGLAEPVRAQVLYAAAILAAAQDDHRTASVLGAQSLAHARAVADAAGVANAYNALGIAALGAGDYPAARDLFEHCLAGWTAQDRPLGMAMAHGNLTKVALRVGDTEAATHHATRSLDLDAAVGNTRGVQLALECLGQIHLAGGDLAAARAALEESLRLSRALGDAFGEAMALHHLAHAAQVDGDPAGAARLAGAALALRHEVGDREDLATSLDTLATLAPAGHGEAAVRLLAAADSLRARHRLPVVPDALADRERTLDRLRAGLPEPAIAAAWTAGRATPLDLIVGEALRLAELIADG